VRTAAPLPFRGSANWPAPPTRHDPRDAGEGTIALGNRGPGWRRGAAPEPAGLAASPASARGSRCRARAPPPPGAPSAGRTASIAGTSPGPSRLPIAGEWGDRDTGAAAYSHLSLVLYRSRRAAPACVYGA